MATEMARKQAPPEVVFGADRIADDETYLLAAVELVGRLGTGGTDAHSDGGDKREQPLHMMSNSACWRSAGCPQFQGEGTISWISLITSGGVA